MYSVVDVDVVEGVVIGGGFVVVVGAVVGGRGVTCSFTHSEFDNFELATFRYSMAIRSFCSCLFGSRSEKRRLLFHFRYNCWDTEKGQRLVFFQ